MVTKGLLKEMVTKVVTRRSDGCSIVVTRVAPGCGDKGLLKDVVAKGLLKEMVAVVTPGKGDIGCYSKKW
jgi:hypothetical protein